MNNRTVLQVPMPKNLKTTAEAAAYDYGFSSLQETVRIFLKKLAEKTIEVNFIEKPKPVYLSAKAIKRYNKMTDDFDKGKNIYQAKNIDDLMAQLNGNILPRKLSKKLS